MFFFINKLISKYFSIEFSFENIYVLPLTQHYEHSIQPLEEIVILDFYGNPEYYPCIQTTS